MALVGTRCFLLDLTKAALGRHLFNELQRSYDNRGSCAGCHNPNYGDADGVPDICGSSGASGTTDMPTMVNKDLNVLSVSTEPAARMRERSAKGNATDEHTGH
ncbi:MAG TPA: cytochrome c peroxidase [Nitrospiraceae bacterium]|nr:cytochrome c peroxidase [Nitrospiraceae bacterium]